MKFYKAIQKVPVFVFVFVFFFFDSPGMHGCGTHGMEYGPGSIPVA